MNYPDIEQLFRDAYELSQQGKDSTARQVIQQLLSIAPDHIEALVLMGYLSKGDEARAYFDHALQLDPYHVQAQRGLLKLESERQRRLLGMLVVAFPIIVVACGVFVLLGVSIFNDLNGDDENTPTFEARVPTLTLTVSATPAVIARDSTVTPLPTPFRTVTPISTLAATPRQFVPPLTGSPTDAPSLTELPPETATETPVVTETMTETPTATSTEDPNMTWTPTPTVTATITITPTVTPTPTTTSTEDPNETWTPTPSPTVTLTATETVTPTVTATTTETQTPTSTITGTTTATSTATMTVTATQTQTSTVTQTATVTSTEDPAATWTATPTVTATSTSTVTPTPTETVTVTATSTETVTVTPTNTQTPTTTMTVTPTATLTTTVTPTPTLTVTLTVTPTNTVTPTPIPTNTYTPLPTSTDTPAGPDYTVFDDSGAMLNLVNQERCANGLNPVTLSGALNSAATTHSIDMAVNDFVDHPGTDGSTPSSRMTTAGYGPILVSAENVHGGSGTVGGAFSSWMASPGHAANILDPTVLEMGLGHVYRDGTTYFHYWTMNLGSRGTTPITCADIGL